MHEKHLELFPKRRHFWKALYLHDSLGIGGFSPLTQGLNNRGTVNILG